MWSKVAVLLTVVALANAKRDWHYKTRMPTVSPKTDGLALQKVVENDNLPEVFIPGWKAVENCGVRPPGTKIVGGTDATPNSWPWQVGLFLDNTYFCGGSIIDTNVVLTAAHCTDGITSVEVVAGAHNIRVDEPSQQIRKSTNMTIHANWTSALIRNDISLIFIEPGFDFSKPEVGPVCLPTRDQELGVGRNVTPTGWGKTADGLLVGLSETLQEVTVPTISNDVCADYYGNLIIKDSMVCIDTNATGVGMGTCSGDSGGPLNYDDGSGIYVTHGITSFGASAGCQEGYPGAFTRVTEFLDWIETNSGIKIG